MVGEFSKISYTSLSNIQRFTLSERGPHLFHFLPIGVDPCLNVRNGFCLHRRFEQMPEPAPQLKVLFNRHTLRNVGVDEFSPVPLDQGNGLLASVIFSAPLGFPPPVRKPYTGPPKGPPPAWTGECPSRIARIGHTAQSPA